MENNKHKDNAGRSIHTAQRALGVVIAGGGTGGHLFPGIAMAQEFLARNPKNRILFVGTGKSFELSILAKMGFKHQRITAEGIKGRRLRNRVLSIAKVPKGIFESLFILKRFRPDIVIGVGGYAAGPLVVAAWLLGIKIALHEQNILPGMTNRMLFRFAHRIYVSFNGTQVGARLDKIRLTGNPVRKEILKCAKQHNHTSVTDVTTGKVFNVLVIGGSQGAHSINMALLEAIKRIENKDQFFIVHQTGIQDEAQVKRAYADNAIFCEVQAFFNDMDRRYKEADLTICRAGATTVAEITTMGKGVIFIPFPYAADNHQVLNAQSLEKSGAAELILEKDLSGKILAEKINFFASHREALYQMAARAKELGRPDAAADIVDDCYRLVESVT
ncbi:MAG: undecaprenyldiphospho-muramoylpentapeptide beta-N-acetylglucosaminyltransferase [Desulfobacterales bacterium]|nr:MAG: undecaprenyldiphospho-muramoylpentapeptide beta-N-acetylglucosaminyltransferase [Desulfobacterales bacterium]